MNPIRTFALSALMSAPLVVMPVYSQTLKTDTFERSISASGTRDSSILNSAPNPEVVIAGEKKYAAIVVDVSKNILYKYNSDAEPEAAYLVASGKKRTPTRTGVRIVNRVEDYPYSDAYGTKRKRNPKAYGPNVLNLDIIDPKSGMQSRTGQFIHGNNDSTSIGNYASLGCVRMDNEVIKKLAKEIKAGDIVVIK